MDERNDYCSLWLAFFFFFFGVVEKLENPQSLDIEPGNIGLEMEILKLAEIVCRSCWGMQFREMNPSPASFQRGL